MNKTTAALLGLLMTASLANAGHTEPDGDDFPGVVEHVVCTTGGSSPNSGDVVNLLGVAGSCDTSTGNYTFGVGSTPASCPGCSNETILHRTNVPLSPGGPVGPISTPPTANVTFFETYNKSVGGTTVYCLYLDPVELACVNVFGAPVSPIGPIYIANATVPQQNVPATSVDVHVQYRWIDANITLCCSVGSGPLLEVYYPVDPSSPSDVAWWAQNGNQTSLEVEIQLRLDGNPTGPPVQVSIPYAGQAMAAGLKSSPTNPFPL